MVILTKLSLWLRLMLPRLIAILSVVLTSIPVGLPGISHFMPMVDIMAVYYWCVFRPDTMPNWFVFLLGMLRDTISGGPLGVAALTNLVIYLLVLYKREYYATVTFSYFWKLFALFASVAAVLKWIVFSFIYDTFLAINMAFMQLLLSVSLYPLFHLLFSHIHMKLPGESADA